MNKILVPYPSKINRKFYSENEIDGFIIGIKDYSENFNSYVTESNLKSTIEKLNDKNIKAYIMLNKVYFNEDIDGLIKLLKKIDKLNVEAVIFSDIAIFNIVRENNLDIKLIISNKMITNSRSINFLYSNNPFIILLEKKFVLPSSITG